MRRTRSTSGREWSGPIGRHEQQVVAVVDLLGQLPLGSLEAVPVLVLVDQVERGDMAAADPGEFRLAVQRNVPDEVLDADGGEAGLTKLCLQLGRRREAGEVDLEQRRKILVQV